MTDNRQQPEDVAQTAMKDLARHELAPTPEHYAVFYHYHTGDMPALAAALDALLAQGRPSAVAVDEIYHQHLGVYAKSRVLADNNRQLEDELRKIAGLVAGAMSGSDKFGKSLSAFSGQLDTAGSIETLRAALGKVMEETRAVADENRKLQTELVQAVGQLQEVQSSLDQVSRESQIDALTQVGNRKFFDREFARALDEARERGEALSLLMIDIDHFKRFNDTHGHLIGDQVLRLVARTLVENLKGRDIIARYGGEEFVIILPQTREADAEKVANLLRAGLATKQIKRRDSNEVLGTVTISIGAAQHAASEDGESLIGRADAALYEAKQGGRNRVVCAGGGKK